MGKHRPRLTPEQREARNNSIASDWMAGLTAQEIADTHDVFPSAVFIIVRQRKLPKRRKKSAKWYAKRRDKIAHLLRFTDKTYQEIADLFGINQEQVYALRVSLGLPERKTGPRPKSP